MSPEPELPAARQVLAKGSAQPCLPSCLGWVLGAGAMARLGDGEHTMSVLERLLANAALRDEAGRLHSPEARAHPPSGVSQGVRVWSPGWEFCLVGLPLLSPPGPG